MEQLPDDGKMKSEPQKCDSRTQQDWYDPIITVRTESQENNNPEVILPDWSYLKSESESETEDTVTVETAEWNFKARSVDREQLSSVMEASFDTSPEIEDFSIKTEPEEDLVLFVDLEDKEREENKKMVRERIQELTSNLGDNVSKTDGLISIHQDEMRTTKQCVQESTIKRRGEEFLCEENTCSIRDESNGNMYRNSEKERPFQDTGNEQTGKESSVCDSWKNFGSGDSSKVQNVVCSSETPYKCDQCGKECLNFSNKGYQISVLSSQRPSCPCRRGKYPECYYCGHIFTKRSNMDKHIQNVHLKQRLHECHECGQKFGQSSDMKHHVKTVHLKIKQFECQHCGQRFCKNSIMKNHVQNVHLKKKQHECQQCGQRFGEKGNLDRHIRIVHLKEKQYGCQHCGQKFGRSCDMNKHVRIVHLKDKQHECQHCGQRFSVKQNMTSHVQTVHLKKKLFECQTCGQSFGKKSNMRSHIKIVHLKIKRYECLHCGQTFGHKCNMEKHVKCSHLKEKCIK